MNKTYNHILGFVKNSKFRQISDFTIKTISEGEVTASVKLTEVFRRHDGIAHGGYISYFADSIMGFAALTKVDEGKTVYTAEMKVSFLNPGYGKELHGKAVSLRSGKTIHFTEAEIFAYNEDGEQYLVAKASGTMVAANSKRKKSNVDNT